MPHVSQVNNNYYSRYRETAPDTNTKDGNTVEDVRRARYEDEQIRENEIRSRETQENRRNRYTSEEEVGGTINIRV
jgi:hypothetical protein